MSVKELTPVQSFIKKHAPTGGALPPHLQEELKLLIAQEENALSPQQVAKDTQDALQFLGLPTRDIG